MKVNLKNIDFTGDEERIIDTIVQLNRANARDLIRVTGLPKSSVFRIISDLKDKGIISDDGKTRANFYHFTSPEALVNAVSKKRRQYRKMELDLQELLETTRRGEVKSLAHVQVFHKLEQFRELTEQSLLAKERIMLDFGNLETLEDAIGEDFDEQTYLPERLKNKIFLRMLTHHTPRTEQFKKLDTTQRREIRFLPSSSQNDSYWKVFDDTVIIYSNPKEKFVIRVQSKTLANLFKHMFEIMWDAVV